MDYLLKWVIVPRYFFCLWRYNSKYYYYYYYYILLLLLLLFKMWGSGSVRRSARLLLQPSQLASRWIFQFLFCEIVLNQRNNTKKRQCQNARFEVERLGIRSCHLPSDSQCSHSYCWHWFGYKRSFFQLFWLYVNLSFSFNFPFIFSTQWQIHLRNGSSIGHDESWKDKNGLRL